MMPVNRGRIPTVNCFEKSFQSRCGSVRSKKSGRCFSLKLKKENAMNCEKLLTPIRLSGNPLIAVCALIIRIDLQKGDHYE